MFGNYRMLPVCPSEYRPGCGQTVSPCGSRPTGICFTAPVVVSKAYTTPSKCPETQKVLPSALTLPMSGLPPPGIGHVATILRVAKSITEIFPGPCDLPWTLCEPRLVMYSFVASRLG